MPEQPLCNRVAVVAGATRGAGRGIARMLGAAGATVYCTGRSVRGRPATPGRPETIEETAALVTAEGGRGIAVRTDHTVESAVEQLFARDRAEAGRLDVLVNDIWGSDALTEWGRPFWELTIAHGQQMLERGGPQPHHHQPARRAADDRAGRRTHRRGHGRRHARLSRQPLLRSGEERGHPARPRDGRRPLGVAWRFHTENAPVDPPAVRDNRGQRFSRPDPVLWLASGPRRRRAMFSMQKRARSSSKPIGSNGPPYHRTMPRCCSCAGSRTASRKSMNPCGSSDFHYLGAV